MNENILSVMGMDYTDINLFPQTTIEEILQNVSVLLTTVVGTVPLDRNLGLNATFIDHPSPRAMAKIRIFAEQTIKDYEPRVEFISLEFIHDKAAGLDGKLYPRVKVRILDEYI